MDEVTAQLKARHFVANLDLSRITEDLSVYIEQIGAKVEFQELEPGESGFTIIRAGKPRIVINSLESPARQRFTLCHEIAHVILELPSEHDEAPSWAFVKRHENEILCDIFAAELLMPINLFRKDIGDQDPSLTLIDELALKYQTSFPATGSRLANLSTFPCAFVFMEHGVIRYASRSPALRGLNGWVAPRTAIPASSVANEIRSANQRRGQAREVPFDIWFADWKGGGDLLEAAQHYAEHDQTFSLIWFDEEDISPRPDSDRCIGEHNGIRELDGNLPWPSGHRRR